MLKFRFLRYSIAFALALATIASLPRAGQAGLWPSSLTPQTTQAREVAQRPHPAVVRVIAPEEGGTSFGSGTLVDVRGDYGLVLTNWHVVADATHTIEVLFPDGFRTAARVITTDRTWDLAVLAVWRPNVAPVRLASQPPKPGEPLTIAGYGSGKYRAVTGTCTQYVAPALNRPYEMVELSVAARQGDSGGPIFNSQGELAGVLWGAGWGTTAGSYCGRVASFVAAIMPPPGVGEEPHRHANRSSADRNRRGARPRSVRCAGGPDKSPRQGRCRPALDGGARVDCPTVGNFIRRRDLGGTTGNVRGDGRGQRRPAQRRRADRNVSGVRRWCGHFAARFAASHAGTVELGLLPIVCLTCAALYLPRPPHEKLEVAERADRRV